jgi:hypothetical protein
MRLPARLEKICSVLARQGPAGLLCVIRDHARGTSQCIGATSAAGWASLRA